MLVLLDMGEKNIDVLSMVEEEWLDPHKETEPSVSEMDWRIHLLGSFREGDIDRMKMSSLPMAQWKMVELANEGTKEDVVKFQATKFLLEQAGHGSVQKVEHTLYDDRMKPSELRAIIASKLKRLKEINPDFDVSGLVVEAEVIESDEAGGASDE